MFFVPILMELKGSKRTSVEAGGPRDRDFSAAAGCHRARGAWGTDDQHKLLQSREGLSAGALSGWGTCAALLSRSIEDRSALVLYSPQTAR